MTNQREAERVSITWELAHQNTARLGKSFGRLGKEMNRCVD